MSEISEMNACLRAGQQIAERDEELEGKVH